MSSYTELLSQTVMFIHQLVFKIKGKITEPWNVSHSDLHVLLFWDQTSGHTEPLSQTIMFIHQIVFKILGKITEPWNIGHADLHFMTHKSMSQGWAMCDKLYACYFQNRFVEIHILKVSYILISSPTPGHEPWGQYSWHGSRHPKGPMVQIWMLSDEWFERYTHLEKL